MKVGLGELDAILPTTHHPCKKLILKECTLVVCSGLSSRWGKTIFDLFFVL